MKLRNLALATAGLLLLVFTLPAQITTIEGIVKGADGKPVQGAQIQIVRTDIKGNYPTKTDKKGHYIYTGLPMGMYTINVIVDGKQVDSRPQIHTSPSDTSVQNFDLAASQQAANVQRAAVQQAMETGQISKDLERQLTPEQKKQLEEKMKQQEAAMKKNKELNDAFNAGVAAQDAKQYDQAIDAFAKASEIGPDQMAVWAHLADAYMARGSTKTGADHDADMQKSIEAYGKALAIKPDDASLHNNYGRALSASNRMPEALAEMQKAAQLDPANASRYFFNLGALLTNAGKGEEASQAFKKAIDSAPEDPKNAESYYQYGISLMSKAQVSPTDGKVVPAPGTIEAFQKYLALAPTGPHAEDAKGMLTTLGSTLQTSYEDPSAKKKKKK